MLKSILIIDDDPLNSELIEKILSKFDHEVTSANNAKDALVGAVEGKLPVKMKDGKLLPIEMTVKVRFDPNTQKLEVISWEFQIKSLKQEKMMSV